MIKKTQINLFSFFFLPSVGGAQVCAHSMAMAYTELGFEVNLITSEDSYQFLLQKKLPYNLISAGKIPLGLVKKSTLFQFIYSEYLYLKLKNKLEKLSLNIVFGLWPFGLLISKLLKNKYKFLIRPTGDDIQIDESVKYGLARDYRMSKILNKILDKNKYFLAISETVKKNISHDKIVITSTPGVHSEYFNKLTNFNLDKFINKKYNSKERIIISVGRNHPKKCFDHLFLLARKLPNNYKFCIIGKNTKNLIKNCSDEKILCRFNFIEELSPNLDKNNFYFPSERLINHFLSAHYFVYPTKTETYANVALEAMASYLPCILSRVPGNIDTIKNNNGILYNFGQIDEIVDKILFLEKNPIERSKIILKGKSFSEKNDWKNKCYELLNEANDTLFS